MARVFLWTAVQPVTTPVVCLCTLLRERILSRDLLIPNSRYKNAVRKIWDYRKMDIIWGPTTKLSAFLHVYLYGLSEMGRKGWLFQWEGTYNHVCQIQAWPSKSVLLKVLCSLLSNPGELGNCLPPQEACPSVWPPPWQGNTFLYPVWTSPDAALYYSHVSSLWIPRRWDHLALCVF